MDSPNQPPPIPIPLQPTPISSFSPSRKLPIKRKTPPIQTPQIPSPNHPRIWTQQDEIQFLHNLLDPSSQPSNALSHPFTKSQLSDKLRRLRKKFHIFSEKLDHSLVSPHDRKLYELMKQLWEPQTEPSFHTTPFNEHFNENNESNLVAVLALPSVVQKPNNCVSRNDNVSVGNVVKGRVKDDEVKVKVRGDSEVVVKALGEVVDESLNVVRNRMMRDVGRLSGVEKEVQFEKRWREQRMEEFEVFAKRVKLIMENGSVVGK